MNCGECDPVFVCYNRQTPCIRLPLQRPMNIDWGLLSRQKLTLIAMASDEHRPVHEVQALDGVINLLDALMDNAAADPAIGPRTVFGEPV